MCLLSVSENILPPGIILCWVQAIDPAPGAWFMTNSYHSPSLSPAQYSLNSAESQPKTPIISFLCWVVLEITPQAFIVLAKVVPGLVQNFGLNHRSIIVIRNKPMTLLCNFVSAIEIIITRSFFIWWFSQPGALVYVVINEIMRNRYNTYAHL